ncbi:MAG TPA: SRPBCC family protein [Luteitalea sp.]|nr:SRPBCC family protein [Luteitalea sp.]
MNVSTNAMTRSFDTPVRHTGSLGHTTYVGLPLADVWRTWTNVCLWPLWDRDLDAAFAEGALAVGVRGTLIKRNGRRLRFQVLDIEEGSRYVIRVDDAATALTITRSLSGDGTITSLTEEVTVDGPLRWFSARRIRRVLPATLLRLTSVLTQAHARLESVHN